MGYSEALVWVVVLDCALHQRNALDLTMQLNTTPALQTASDKAPEMHNNTQSGN